MLIALAWMSVPEAHADVPMLVAFDLPIAARQLRHDGVPHAEVRSIIVGSRERHLRCDEIHAVLVRSHKAVLLNGPVPHLDDVVLVQLDGGVRGPALYVYLDDYYGVHGDKHAKDDLVVVGPGWTPGSLHDNGHGNVHWDNGNHGGSPGKSHVKSHGGGHGKGHGK